ncbi:MAG: ATP-binding protein, partial [Bacteroidota bacterium]
FNRLQKQRAELQLQQKILNSEREYKAQIRLQQIARLEQEKELLARQRMFIGIGLGLTALLLGLVFWLLSQAQKRNKMLSAEKQKVETQSHKLREIEQSKNHFFINIAHELRTPLTLIKGPIKHLLKQKNLSQGTEKLLQIIDSQSENMHEQLDQILYLDHPKKEETNYHFQRFQIGELMDSLLPSFYAMAEMQGIDFSLESDDFSAFSLDVEKAKLQTILKNLLSNAFKFTAKGGEVVLRLRKKADTLVISVIDNGRGIPTQSLPYIFERFYQVPTEYQEGGSGIGLAICKRYVDSLRGTINVKSKAGAGSQFMVEIPVDWFGHSGAFIASESVASSPQIPPDRSKAETENLPLILVVEDQLAMGEFLRIILEKEYQVQLSPNGKEALSFLEKGLLPQLIITDFMMPEMDGKALVQALRKHQIWRSIPVIVLTARNELSEKLSFLRIGVDDYLGKPFLEEELLARIDNLIDNYHQRASFQQLALTPAESAVANSEEDDYDTRWVEKLVKVLQPMISDVDLTLDQVADKMAVSVTHLHRKVKAITGMTAMQFIQDQRFEEAKRQLENNRNISIKAVSYSVGFKSEKNFSRNFRKRYGVLPSVYRMS